MPDFERRRPQPATPDKVILTPYGKHRLQHHDFYNPVHIGALYAGDLMARLRQTKVEGKLPAEGPAFVFANHASGYDPTVIMWLAEKTARRSVRIVARDTLLDPTIKEEEEVLDRTGKGKDLLNQQPLWQKNIIAKTIQLSGNPIPVHRGKPGASFLKEVIREIKGGHMVGMFLQESRSEQQEDLSGAMNGAAGLARMFPDVPSYLVSLTNVSLSKETFIGPQAIISEGLHYEETNPGGRLSDDEVTEIYKDWLSRHIGKK